MLKNAFLDARFTNIKDWKILLQVMSEISDDAVLICNSDGIAFRCTDKSNVASLLVAFPHWSFDSFISVPTFFSRININDLKNIMSDASNTDTINLEIDNSPYRLKISIVDKTKAGGSLNMTWLNSHDPPAPKVHYKNSITVSSAALSRIISSIEKISSRLYITAKPDRILFEGDGMCGKSLITVRDTSPELTRLVVPNEVRSTFDLKYLSILKILKEGAKHVSMDFGNQTSIRLLFNMESNVFAQYFLEHIIKQD